LIPTVTNGAVSIFSPSLLLPFLLR